METDGATPASAARQVEQLLLAVHRLTIAALRCETAESLQFLILNDTHGLLRYHRAALWGMEGRAAPRLLGVSGQLALDDRSELAAAWRHVVGRLSAPSTAGVVDASELPERSWQLVVGEPARSVLWLPLAAADGTLVAGLWVEREAERGWSEQEANLLGVLAEGYAVALERHRPGRVRRWLGRRRLGPLVAGVLALLMGWLAFGPRMPLRVVAPCEVVPRDPVLVSAPLDGVVEEMGVAPGDRVSEGQLLFRYDPRVATQELEVARQQVQVVRSQLERATAMALADEAGEDELEILRHRLAREQARLALARQTVEQLEVRAPAAGVVVLRDPEAWRGKPVEVGERVLLLVDPARTQVQVWVAESDRVEGLERQGVRVFLHVDPSGSHGARLRYLANATTDGPDGVPAFLGEARWDGAGPSAAPGDRGTAVLHGDPVRPGYWLLRRPWSTLRSWLGW